MARSEKTGLGKAFTFKSPLISALQQRGEKKHVDLATGGWVDLTSATELAHWSTQVENLGRREFALYRTARGALILKAPVGRTRVAFALGMVKTPLTTSVQYEYSEVSQKEAAALMAQYGAAREAKRLFPDDFAEHEVRVRDDER
jgi:hypothetical protein